MRRLGLMAGWGVLTWLAIAPGNVALANDFERLTRTIKAVDNEGRGHADATQSLGELSKLRPDVLPGLLREISDANPLAANWLRGAFEAIAEKAVERGEALPLAEFEAFLLDRSQKPRARRLAYEWLAKLDPTAEDRLIPGMLHDPSGEMKRDAVQRLVDAAQKLQTDQQNAEARELYRQALSGAVYDDQVKLIVAALEQLGEKIDLQRHFGFLPEWHLLGPFDNAGGKGFGVAYPPEQGVDLRATYSGRAGEVGWVRLATDDPYGVLDIARDVGPHKGAAMYASTEFMSADAQHVQLRLGTPNAWKLWVNDELLFEREEYHRGMSLDQYRVDVDLKPGRNVFLLKICQNEMEEDWAQAYRFQLRVCDESGTAIASESRVSAVSRAHSKTVSNARGAQ